MAEGLDLACSSAIILVTAAVPASFLLRDVMLRRRAVADAIAEARSPSALPPALRAVLVWALRPLVDGAIAAGISANAVTAFSLAAGACAGGLLAVGRFGAASVAIVVASLGDALDGLIARRTRTASAGGALFDASVDRYEEFFVLGGLSLFFRAYVVVLALALLALLGSFMVSYGSAKAEALGVPVPNGVMRRAERAVCLSAGTVLVPFTAAIARVAHLPDWVGFAPIVVALGVVALAANASAIARLRAVAQAATPPPVRISAAPRAPRLTPLPQPAHAAVPPADAE
jgi:phosphatidylglycerophosphate synthase